MKVFYFCILCNVFIKTETVTLTQINCDGTILYNFDLPSGVTGPYTTQPSVEGGGLFAQIKGNSLSSSDVLLLVNEDNRITGCGTKNSIISSTKGSVHINHLGDTFDNAKNPQVLWWFKSSDNYWNELYIYSGTYLEKNQITSDTNTVNKNNLELIGLYYQYDLDGATTPIVFDLITNNPCYTCNTPAGASNCQSNGTHCIPQYTNTCGFCTHVGVQGGPPFFTTTWYDESAWADGVAGCQASTESSCTFEFSGTTYQCSSDGSTQGCKPPVGEVCLTSLTVDCTTCTHIGVQGGPPLFTTTWYDDSVWTGGVAGCQVSTGDPCTFDFSGATYQCSSDGGSTSNCQSPPQNCHTPSQAILSPPTLPPSSPPKIPPSLPPPSPPPSSSPSLPPLNPSPESPPLYPSPFSPPPLTPPSLPSGAEITVRHYIPEDTQVTFALAVNTTLDLNTVKDQNFSMFDTFAKIDSTENRKVLTRTIYNGNTWEPKENAVLNSDSGYIVKLTNGLDMEINGTVLERQTSNIIIENTQVTFSVKKNTNLNKLNKNLFSLNDTVSSIEPAGYKSRIVKTTLFDGSRWVPEENAHLKIGIGYIGKFEKGLNKIL